MSDKHSPQGAPGDAGRRASRVFRKGECFLCGCNSMRGCLVSFDFETFNAVTCHWVDESQTLCSACEKKGAEA